MSDFMYVTQPFHISFRTQQQCSTATLLGQIAWTGWVCFGAKSTPHGVTA